MASQAGLFRLPRRAAAPPNTEMKLTSPEPIGGSRLIVDIPQTSEAADAYTQRMPEGSAS